MKLNAISRQKKNKYLQKKGKRAVLLNSEYKNTADVWVRKDYIF